jgi:hypothetical protein
MESLWIGELRVSKGSGQKKERKKILSIVQRLVTDYQISRIAIKISRSFQRSKNLESIYLLIRASSKEHGLRLSEFSIEKLKQGCSVARNKQEMIQFLRRRYAELSNNVQRKTQNNYIRQFEAIAVAITTN